MTIRNWIVMVGGILLMCANLFGGNPTGDDQPHMVQEEVSGPVADGLPYVPIDDAFIAAYQRKRATSLTINQINTADCPELEAVVSILDDAGNPIAGLTEADFTVLEDGDSVAFTVRRTTVNTGVGLSLALCIDRSSSLSFGDFQNEKAAARELIQLLGSSDAAAIYAFSGDRGRVDLVQDFTTDKSLLLGAVDSIPLGGFTPLYEAISDALVNTAEQPGRKAVVVMTDGRNSGGSVSFSDLEDQIQTGGIPVFTIGFGNANASVLEQIARESGGAFFPTATSDGLNAILQQIGNILSEQYIISFRTNQPDGNSHRLSVTAQIQGEPVEGQRDYDNCLYELVLNAPDYINQDNFWRDDNGGLICLFPYPNGDGADPDGLADIVYVVSLVVNCQVVYGPVSVGLVNNEDRWPLVVSLPAENIPTEPYQIQVARGDQATGVYAPDQSVSIPGPLPRVNSAGVPTVFRSYDRWLMHIPKLSGGFAATVKTYNRNSLGETALHLAGFNETGRLLEIETLNLPAGATNYFDIYNGGLFDGFQDQLAYIGIFEQGKTATVSLQYRSLASQYGSWIEESDFSQGQMVGSTLEFEAASGAAYTDGVALLNLSNVNAAEVWAVQRDRNGIALEEQSLGILPSGGKNLVVLSDLFPFQAGVYYTLETRDSSRTIQALGLSFFGTDFFNPIPVTPTTLP